MHAPRWLSTVALVLVGVAAAVGLVVSATAGWLTAHYRPSAAGVDPLLLDGSARDTTTWVDVHQGALVVLLGLVLLVLVVVPIVVAEEAAGPRRPVLAGAAGLVALGGAVIGVVTTGALLWDQVALAQVTTGSELDGWWLAAFDDRVRFVLVGGAEVSPETYAGVLVVHLVAPLVAVVALVALLPMIRSARRRRSGPAGPAILR